MALKAFDHHSSGLNALMEQFLREERLASHAEAVAARRDSVCSEHMSLPHQDPTYTMLFALVGGQLASAC